MIRKCSAVLGSIALFGAQPIAAQEAEVSDTAEAEAIAAMAEMFSADPLNDEQSARLPAAESVVLKLMPPGTYMKMMDETMKPVMDGIMGQVSNLPIADIMRMTGLPESELQSLGEGRLGEIMEIMDPAYEQRQEAIFGATMEWMSGLMDEMEPSFRAGLSRAYAVRFSQAELEELDSFFQTPTGAHYAQESMLIMTDPQVMASMGELMPKIFESMPDMMASVQEKAANLPEPRKLEDLSEEETARLNQLLGL